MTDKQMQKSPRTLTDDDIKTVQKGGKGHIGQLGTASGHVKSLSTDPRAKEMIGDPDAG